jgi:hypothetical protein
MPQSKGKSSESEATKANNRIVTVFRSRRTSENPQKAKFASSIMHSPGPIQQIILCRVSKVHRPAYVRH